MARKKRDKCARGWRWLRADAFFRQEYVLVVPGGDGAAAGVAVDLDMGTAETLAYGVGGDADGLAYSGRCGCDGGCAACVPAPPPGEALQALGFALASPWVAGVSYNPRWRIQVWPWDANTRLFVRATRELDAQCDPPRIAGGALYIQWLEGEPSTSAVQADRACYSDACSLVFIVPRQGAATDVRLRIAYAHGACDAPWYAREIAENRCCGRRCCDHTKAASGCSSASSSS